MYIINNCVLKEENNFTDFFCVQKVDGTIFPNACKWIFISFLDGYQLFHWVYFLLDFPIH